MTALPIGTLVVPYGIVGGYAMRESERYYFMHDTHGGVALMPAKFIDTIHTTAHSETRRPHDRT